MKHTKVTYQSKKFDLYLDDILDLLEDTESDIDVENINYIHYFEDQTNSIYFYIIQFKNNNMIKVDDVAITEIDINTLNQLVQKYVE